ncbi:MAG: hypothetical protein EYC70_14610 [Planctomycetota bacterium]|nr:MAG: hypothetical protein EYC70_14610 [Planctomycetota bacterium]
MRDTARDAAPGPRPALAMGGRPSGPKPGALLPWVPLVLVGILAVPLVLWLAKRFGGDEPKPGTNPPAVPAGTSQDPGRAAAPPPVEAVQKGPVHAVVAISYDYNDRQKQLALQTRDQLIRDGFPNVVLLAVPAARPSHYVIYVGEAAEAGTLVPLRDRLRQHSVPGQPGAKPFEKAYVQKRPTIGTP